MPAMMPGMVDGIDGWAGRLSGPLPGDPAPESRFFRLDGDMADAEVVPRWERSLTKAVVPCWVPLIKRGPRAVVSLSGGSNPNGDGTHRIQQRQILGGDHHVRGHGGRPRLRQRDSRSKLCGRQSWVGAMHE